MAWHARPTSVVQVPRRPEASAPGVPGFPLLGDRLGLVLPLQERDMNGRWA